MQKIVTTPVVARRRADLTIHELDNEGFIFDPLTGDTHRLNATAWFIWNHFDGVRTVAAVGAHVAERYDVERDEAILEVERLVAQFDSLGILEPIFAGKPSQPADQH